MWLLNRNALPKRQALQILIMKYSKKVLTTAYFMLITGTINLLMWIFLITTGQVEDFGTTPVAYVFHWVSEFATALLLFIAGMQIVRSRSPSLHLAFLALGALLMAIGGAFYYYISHFEPAIFIFTAVFTAGTCFFILINYRGIKDLIFISLGVTVYGLINIMGQGFQEENPTLVSMTLPATLFMLALVIFLIRKDVRITQPGHQTKVHNGTLEGRNSSRDN